ncbi:MAG: hypothetical protein IH591_13010 [Bacteroidales bacterium]|nr:hypothetical protein [Bacteroidales bacterium]
MGIRVAGLLALAFLSIAGTVGGQYRDYNFTVQTLGGYTTSGVVPFWLRSNQYGSIPLDGASLSLIGAARKDYDLSSDKIFDWGVSFEGRANLGQGSNLTLIEGYGKVRLGIFEFRAGRSKKITGLCDTTLSSGSWAISGNNLGIPEVEFSVREFWTLPILGELFAFKGNFAHGWLGDLRMARFILLDSVTVTSYLHQKSIYGRFGKPSWRLKLYGGFNHQVVWGDEQRYYLDDYTLTSLQTYYYVITGKRYSNGYIQQERQGNHLGSIDLGLEYEFSKVKILLYRQNFYETGALAYLANIQDGLNGISLQNLHRGGKRAIWDKLLLELLYTKNQAGEPWSPESGSPYEPYYNHGQYITGWSYLGSGLGTSFIGTRDYIRDNLAAHPEDYFINNRVMALHFGFEGSVRNLSYILKASWSKNYGTYSTTDEEQSTDIINPGEFGLFGEQVQFSSFLGMNRTFSNGFILGLIGAFDYGNLYYDSFGMFLKASYSFSL